MAATKHREKRRRGARWLWVASKILSAIDKALVDNARNGTIFE